MIIDCGTCVARGDACADCVVTVLLGPPATASADGGAAAAGDTAPWHMDDTEATALAVLAGSGLVPPLRLVTAEDADPGPAGGSPHRRRRRTA